MPFPWKNQKSSRISQMVNNHMQNSQLVIRNGEILKILSMKNQPKPMKIPPENPNQNNNRLILPAPSFTPSSSLCSSPSRSSLHSSTRDSNEVDEHANESGGERHVVCANRVVVAIFKIFLVVVLALGTKKFTVGITISAFLLILIECIGKYTRITLKPCLDSQKGLRFIVQRIKRVLRFKQDNSNSDQTNKDCFKNCEPKPTTSFQETRVVIPDCHVTHAKFKPEEDIKKQQVSRKSGYLESDSTKVVAAEEDNSKSEPLESKTRISRKEKIKSKMKKLVPKKLLSRKEEYNSGSSEMSSTREDTIPSCEEQEETEESGEEKAKQIMDKYSNEGKLGYRAMELKKMVEEEEPVYEDLKRRKKSKKHKIKSKMKKLVPKKLLSSKKQDYTAGSSEFHSLGYDTVENEESKLLNFRNNSPYQLQCNGNGLY